jgi:glutamate/tyrosine decarboxylase-like PLP-dependent enzyme
MTGSRSGGIIAAAWAAMVHMGEEGYTNAVRDMWQIYQQLIEGFLIHFFLPLMELISLVLLCANIDLS